MARIVSLVGFFGGPGNLTVFENIVHRGIKRVFYIYGASGERGGHRHHKTWNILISIGENAGYIPTTEKRRNFSGWTTPRSHLY